MTGVLRAACASVAINRKKSAQGNGALKLNKKCLLGFSAVFFVVVAVALPALQFSAVFHEPAPGNPPTV